jgi:hypothetical protein
MDRTCEEERRSRRRGIFLSCTNTTQIEAIADIERLLGKPVVSSSQAVRRGCVKKLEGTLSPLKPMPRLGWLMHGTRKPTDRGIDRIPRAAFCSLFRQDCAVNR